MCLEKFGWRALPLVVMAALSSACLDDKKEPFPVVKLRAPAAGIEVRTGATALVSVQALDVQDRGVDGAQIIFARPEGGTLSFDGVATSVDSIVVTTASGLIAGVQGVGVASARLLASDQAVPGDTSLIALVKAPTTEPSGTVSLRVPVRIVMSPIPDAGAEVGATLDAELGQ
jgi:hypothetical protein